MRPIIQKLKFPSVIAICLFCAVQAWSQQASAPLVEKSQEQAPIVLNAFTVGANIEAGYKVSTATSATKLNTPLKDIPQTINIVTSDFLKDTASFGVSDSVRYVPNVAKRTTIHQPSTLVIRGFFVSNLFQDGFGIPESNRDLANVARIEVLKGPASATIGRGEVGGAVNYVTKRPLKASQAQVDAVVGSFNFLRAVADTTGPLNSSGSLLYRAIAVYQDNDGWRVHEHYKKRVIYPSFTWNPTARTEVNVSTTLSKTESPGTGAGIWITSRSAGNPAGLPEGPTDRDLDLGEKWDRRNEDESSALATITHSFRDNLVYRQGFFISSRKLDKFAHQGSTRVDIDATTKNLLMRRNMIGDDQDLTVMRAQGDLVARYRAFSAEHTTLVGFEWGHSKTDLISTTGSLTPINLTKPVYGAFPTNIAVSQDTLSTAENFGFPVHHESAFLGGAVKLMAGFRLDTARSLRHFRNVVRADDKSSFGSYTASPRYGLTYAPAKWATVYAVRSVDTQPVTTSFRYGLLPGTDPRRFETFSGARNGTLDEAGLKSELFGGRMSFTAAVFKMTRENQVFNIIRTTADGAIYNENFLSSGEKVEGVELQAFGQVSDRLDFVVSYSNTKGSTISPTGPLFLTSLPRYDIKGFMTYRLHAPKQDGFDLHAGYVKIGEMWGTADNLFRLGSQHRADVGVSYNRGRIVYKFQMNNVFDDLYIEAAPAATVIAWAAPRSIYFSVSYRFGK
jgi:iron complex outermembrane receptor protein